METFTCKSLSDSIVGGLRDLAGKVIDPSPVNALQAIEGNARKDNQFNDYKPVEFGQEIFPENNTEELSQNRVFSKNLPNASESRRRRSIGRKAHRPGVAGGGWEDSDDECPNDSDSLGLQTSRSPMLNIGDTRQESHGSSKHSDRSVDSQNQSDRSTAVHQAECAAELHLVSEAISKDNPALLKRNDIEYFVKRCSLLNCSKIVQLIGNIMCSAAHVVQMHCLQLIEALMRTDLIAPDDIAIACQMGLDKCYLSQDNQNQMKARKIIRILEKLCSNPSIVSKVIPPVENGKGTGPKEQIKLPSRQEPRAVCDLKGAGDNNEDIALSNFSFIRTPFGDASYNTRSATTNSTSLLDSDDSLMASRDVPLQPT